MPRSWLSLSSVSSFSMSAMVTLRAQETAWPQHQPSGPGPPVLAPAARDGGDGPGLFRPSQQALSRGPEACLSRGGCPVCFQLARPGTVERGLRGTPASTPGSGLGAESQGLFPTLVLSWFRNLGNSHQQLELDAGKVKSGHRPGQRSAPGGPELLPPPWLSIGEVGGGGNYLRMPSCKLSWLLFTSFPVSGCTSPSRIFCILSIYKPRAGGGGPGGPESLAF